MLKTLLTILTILYCPFLYTQVTLKKEMNGISYKKYKNFDTKWKLVTVRFRKDTEELRFTYANALAYKTLAAGKTNYPDGAVFGKVGVKTAHDPLFESSVIPNGARRYQLMVRNKEKYKEQAGWGYALFDERGITFPEDHKSQINACAACHNAAEERGFVFSQMANTAPRPDLEKIVFKNKKSKIYFEMLPRINLPDNILKLIPSEFNFIRVLSGDITESIFQGTLEEVRPILSKETLESRQPAILKSFDGLRFSIVLPENIGVLCNDFGKSGIFMKSIITNINNTENSVSELNYCFTH